MNQRALLIGLGLLLTLVFLGNAANFYHIGLNRKLDAKDSPC